MTDKPELTDEQLLAFCDANPEMVVDIEDGYG